MTATRLIASAGLAALLSGCMTAPPPTPQELSAINQATSPLMPATAEDRALAEKQDLLTPAKFWAEVYDKNPNEYEA